MLPHLNVAQNVVFGLTVHKPPPVERGQRLTTVAEIVGLSELLHRKPAQLSATMLPTWVADLVRARRHIWPAARAA